MCGWYLLVLGLGTCRRGQAVIWGWLLLALCLGQVNERPKTPRDPQLPAIFPLVSATERIMCGTWVVWGSFWWNHQVQGRVVFSRLIQIESWHQCCVWEHSAKVSVYCCPPGAFRPLWWDKVLGSCQGRINRVHQIKIWCCGGISQHRKGGAFWLCRKLALTLKAYNSVTGIPWEFFKKVCNTGLGWLPLTQSWAVSELGRVGF